MNQRGGRNVEARPVSMKSGLGDRNNKARATTYITPVGLVSMKSGLGDRNNDPWFTIPHGTVSSH